MDQPPDLWQTAYDNLDGKSRSKLESFRKAGENSRPSRTTEIVENVIARTQEGYRQYEVKGLTMNLGRGKKPDVRDTAHRVLRSALSFKDIVLEWLSIRRAMLRVHGQWSHLDSPYVTLPLKWN